MFPFIKLLKIVLPVATVTSATIATTFLVSSSRDDLLNKEKEEDSKLTDFVNLVEDFKERTIFYSKKGDGDGTVALSEEESKKLQDFIDKGVDISKLGQKPDSVSDQKGAQPPKPNVQSQGDQSPSTALEIKDNTDQDPSIKVQDVLHSIDDSKVNSALDPSKNVDNLGTDSDQEIVKADDKDGEQNSQLLIDQENKETSSDSSVSQVAEPSPEENQKLQKTEDTAKGNVDLDNQEGDTQKAQVANDSSQEKDIKGPNSPEDGNDVSGDEHNILEGKKENEKSGPKGDRESGKETGGSTNQQQGNEHNDLLGHSDENRFNLQELQKLEGELDSARNSLNELLSRL